LRITPDEASSLLHAKLPGSQNLWVDGFGVRTLTVAGLGTAAFMYACGKPARGIREWEWVCF
jgi:hypothetical protein